MAFAQFFSLNRILLFIIPDIEESVSLVALQFILHPLSSVLIFPSSNVYGPIIEPALSFSFASPLFV